MIELYSSLLLKLRKFRETNGLPGITSLKKMHLIAIGLLYCHADNRSKVHFLFNLFVNDNGQFCQSEDFDEFLFSLFMIPSYCMLSARKKIGNNYDEIGKIEDIERFLILDAFETVDIVRLRDLFKTEFFKGNNFLNRQQFEGNFSSGDFGWIFSSKGIRANLEIHNDVKPQEQ
jgi:hypothetical protein